MSENRYHLSEDVLSEEDDIPLSEILYREGVFWSQNYPNVDNHRYFEEHAGPKIEAENPLELFFLLLPA